MLTTICDDTDHKRFSHSVKFGEVIIDYLRKGGEWTYALELYVDGIGGPLKLPKSLKEHYVNAIEEIGSPPENLCE